MDYETLFPGRFVKSADLLGKDVTLIIRHVKAEKIDDKQKAVIGFEGTSKEMVMNRTNAEAIKLMFGRETNDWIGKRVTFFPATIKDPFGDGEVGALRVRGSPEITKAMSATVQRGRKTIKVSVVPTGKPVTNGNGKPKATVAQTPVPEVPAGLSEDERLEILAKENAAAASNGKKKLFNVPVDEPEHNPLTGEVNEPGANG